MPNGKVRCAAVKAAGEAKAKAEQARAEAARKGGTGAVSPSALVIDVDEAGFERVATFGVQAYLAPLDPSGPALLAGVVRSLAPAIIRHGIATAEQLDVATLEHRLAEASRHDDAVILPPTVVGAWGYSPEA